MSKEVNTKIAKFLGWKYIKDGDIYCKADRSNAMQPDGAYFYFFTETTEPIE